MLTRGCVATWLDIYHESMRDLAQTRFPDVEEWLAGAYQPPLEQTVASAAKAPGACAPASDPAGASSAASRKRKSCEDATEDIFF